MIFALFLHFGVGLAWPSMDNGREMSGERTRDDLDVGMQPNQARPALIRAFAEAMMQDRFSRLSVGKICAAAGVGRTTFYLHFRNLDELLMAVLSPLIDDIADGLMSARPSSSAAAVLQHVWEQRRQSELWRDPGFRARFTAALAARLETAEGAAPLAAAFVAAGVTEVLHGWTAGRIAAQPDALLETLRRLGAALRADGTF